MQSHSNRRSAFWSGIATDGGARIWNCHRRFRHLYLLKLQATAAEAGRQELFLRQLAHEVC